MEDVGTELYYKTLQRKQYRLDGTIIVELKTVNADLTIISGRPTKFDTFGTGKAMIDNVPFISTRLL